MVLKLRPLVTVAGVSQIRFLGVRIAEWLRPGLWEVLTIKLRGIEPGQILIAKKSIVWADGDEKPRPGITMAGIDLIIRGQDGRVVKAGALGGTHDNHANP